MRSLRIVLPWHAALELSSSHLLLACAAIAATVLLTSYVGLLNDAVARGIQWRADQLLMTATSARPAKAVLPVSVTFARTRKGADAAGEGAR